MRLLNCRTLEFLEFRDDRKAPRYAILSHRWEDDEVSFQDMNSSNCTSKRGFQKNERTCEQANLDGLEYVWIDTCCIDKTDAVELQRSINSMFRWYKNAAKCYVYLSDVLIPDDEVENNSNLDVESVFRTARWFTRGWTLQELIAPRCVEFFSQKRERLGDRNSLEKQIY